MKGLDKLFRRCKFVKSTILVILDTHCNNHDSKINNGFSNSLSLQDHGSSDQMINGYLNENESGKNFIISFYNYCTYGVVFCGNQIQFLHLRIHRLVEKKKKHRL